MLTRVAFVLGVLAVLAPQLAQAHGGSHPAPGAIHAQIERQNAAGAAAPVSATRIEPSSCPGGLGGKCCHSAAAVCSGYPTPALVSAAWRPGSFVRNHAPVPPYAATLSLQSSFSRAQARAPPAIS